MPAPNGSTVILYGHDNGLKVLWRGGKRIKQLPTQDNASANRPAKDADIIVIDDDDDEDGPPQKTQNDKVEYEEEEEEMDSDCPFASIIHELDINLGSLVLNLAVPLLPARHSVGLPPLQHRVLAVTATADGRVTLLSIPLAPPRADRARDVEASILADAIQLQADATNVRDISVKYFAEPEQQILVATVSESLRVWHLSMSDGGLRSQSLRHRRIILPSLTTKVSFQPSHRSSQLLLLDVSGAVRIYNLSGQPSTSVSGLGQVAASQSTAAGDWTMTYHAPFYPQRQGEPSVAPRKKMLDARWVLDGRCILAVFDDGEWGVWDTLGSSQTGENMENFALRGFLDSASASEPTEPVKQKHTNTKLAPMTPNTRKAKAENLFAAPAKTPGIAARGGISVSRTASSTGSVDESVMIWHNGDLYSIPSFQSFWQRSTSGTGGLGSLYAPGIAHVQGVSLFNEIITSVSQFDSKATSSGLGRLNTQRDFLVSAEHRFIIVQNRSRTPASDLFHQGHDGPAKREQRMLEAGDLDLGGMNKIIDGMADGQTRSRRVGFAH